MTYNQSIVRVSYDGDGATTAFPVPFKFFQNSHVKATLRDVNDGETVWTEGLQYTLVGVGLDAGGTLTAQTGYIPLTGESLIIELDVPIEQLKSYPLGGNFPSPEVEQMGDLAAQRDAQLDTFMRNLTFNITEGDSAAGNTTLPNVQERAGKYFGFDAQGRPAMLSGTAESADISDKLVLPTNGSQAYSIADLFGLGALTGENIRLYGAEGDFQERADGTVSNASPNLSAAGYAFTNGDVQKKIWVEGASTTGKTITAIANAPVDAAYQWDADGVPELAYVDQTEDFVDAGAGDVDPFPATEAIGDRFYIGHIQTFDEVSITIATSGTVGVVQWKYWDGSAWSNLTVTDNTNSFKAAPGTYTVTFTPPGDWEATQVNTPVNGRFLYYIAAEITTVYTVNPVLSQGVLDGGRIRVTATTHLVEPLSYISIKNVTGTTEANGTWLVERINNDNIDLIGSTFSNTYISGGTIHNRLETTIQSVSGGTAILAANSGIDITGTARFGFGTDDTLAIQAAIDTGKTVIVPNGDFFCDQVIINNDNQKMIGMGGRLVAIPQTLSASDGGRWPLVKVEANFVEVAGLIVDNPSLGNSKESPEWPAAIQTGISVLGFQCNIHHNIVRRFLDGISVFFSPGSFTGFEYAHNIISNNIVWDVLGAGSGDDNRIDNQGESSGDGIVSWGASTIITNNIVRPREGADCRIGIHTEALSDRHDPDPVVAGTVYPNSGTIIADNIVLAYDGRHRNGRWRRGIIDEGVQHCAITGNIVYGGGWWLIGVITGGSLPDPKGNYTVANNVCIWTAPYVEKSGDDWSPNKAAIVVYGNTNGKLGGVAVTGNVVENWGWCYQAIYVGSFTGTTERESVTVSGNTCIQRFNGRYTNSLFRISQNGGKELTVVGNTFRGWEDGSGQALVRIQNGYESLTFNGNIVKWEIVPPTNDKCIEISGDDAIVSGNHFDGGDPTAAGGGDGVHVINMDRAIVTDNIIINCGDDGVDGFGTTSKILTGNIFENIGGSYTTNWTPGATVIDANNIKN